MAAAFDPDNSATGANWYFGYDFAGSTFGDYDIGEVLICDSAIGIDDMNKVGTYLAARWGFTWTTIPKPLKAWYDFSDVSKLWQEPARTTPISADGQTIGGVTDASGSGYHLDVPNANQEPAYKTGIINGKSVARFDGTDDLLRNTTVSAEVTQTVFLVLKKNSAPTAADDGAFAFGSTAAALLTHSSYSADGYLYDRSNTLSRIVLGGKATNVSIVALRYTGSGTAPMDTIINGHALPWLGGAFNPDDAFATAGLYLGTNASTAYGDYDIGEARVYSGALAMPDVHAIGAELGTKWGVTYPVPPRVPGLKAWYDFSDISTLFQGVNLSSVVTADTNPIYSVADLSGRQFHLSNNGGTVRPLYRTGIINGRSVARFDNVDDWLANTSMLADTSWTIFIVAQKRSAPSAGIDSLFAVGNSQQAVISTWTTVGTGYFWGKNEAATNQHIGGTPANVNCIALRINSAASLDFFINGGTPTNLDPLSDVTTSTTFWYGFDNAQYGDYDIGEVVIYDTPLNKTNMNTIGSYLASKWGFTWTNLS
jgi:hypothetical protein